MKKLLAMLLISMTAVFSVNAQCRVVQKRGVCNMSNEGVFLQIGTGMNLSPCVGFAGDLSLEVKTHSGIVPQIIVDGQYSERPSLGCKFALNYNFPFVRKYTTMVMPIIGVEGGFSGYKSNTENKWGGFPCVGYRVGMLFAFVPGTLNVGLVYNGDYNFAIESLAQNSQNFMNHDLCIALEFAL